jgi:predicted nucleic acid-binding protein
LKQRVLLDAGFFSVHFGGTDERAKKIVENAATGKLEAYVLHLNLTEFLYNYAVEFGWEAAKTKHSLISSSLFVKQVATTEEIALKAAQIKLRNTSLSLADSYLLAAAEILHARIATTDSALKGVRADTILLKF